MPSKTTQTYGKRVALEARRPDLSVIIGVMIKIGFIVKQGDVVGKISASGEYRRRSRTTATGTGFAVDSAVGQVTDASVFAPGDLLKDGNGVMIGIVAANGINVASAPDQVTLIANALVAVAAGAAVVASDGSQVAKGISDEETDGTEAASCRIFIGGYLDETKLRGLDASAKTEMAGASMAGDIFKL